MPNWTYMGLAVQNKLKSFLNPEFIKDQSLILASLALVVSRIIVASVSALQTRGTADGPYRYREFGRTYIRETGGFTLGFLVLRAFQMGIKKALRIGLNIKEPDGSGYYYDLFKNLKAAWNGVKPETLKPDYAKEVKVQFHETGGFGKLGRLLQKIDLAPKAPEKAEKVFAKIYRHAPIIIGSIPTVFLAGYMLERLTRDHSEAIVDMVSKHLGGTAKKNPVPVQSSQQPVSPQPLAGIASVPPVMPQFGANRYGNPYRTMPNLFAAQRI